MYHFELKDFPNVYTQFNVSERDMALFLVEWTKGGKVEIGERRWDPQETELTVLEGPHLELSQLSLGRGWSSALSSGEDVTERVLDAVKNPQPEQAGAQALEPLDDGEALNALLGADAPRLLASWRQLAARSPELRPSEALALAEHALRTPAD